MSPLCECGHYIEVHQDVIGGCWDPACGCIRFKARKSDDSQSGGA